MKRNRIPDQGWLDQDGSEEQEERKSKSQLKRESKEMIDFAKTLSNLTPKQINLLNFPEDILEEIEKARTTKSMIAKNRQIKYAGAVIRSSGEYPELLAEYKRVFKK